MDADVAGALAQINRSWRVFQHRGKAMTKKEVEAVLKYAIQKGYKATSELSDEEVDEVIKNSKT